MSSSHRGDRGDIQMPCKLHVFLPGGSEIHMGIKMIKHDVYVYVYIYICRYRQAFYNHYFAGGLRV